MTDCNPFRSIAALAFIVVALMGTVIVPSSACTQTEIDDQGLQQLLVKAAQLESEFRQVADVEAQILLLKQVIDCYDSATVGLKNGEPEFLVGSALEEAEAELITNAIRNLQQSSLQKSFELSQLLQTAKRYPELCLYWKTSSAVVNCSMARITCDRLNTISSCELLSG